jgi:hypothetical protein
MQNKSRKNLSYISAIVICFLLPLLANAHASDAYLNSLSKSDVFFI